jgi:UrcA family protein
MNITHRFCSLIATAAAVFTGVAAAASEPEPLMHTVAFADLNLSTPAGVSALYTRLRNAAEIVCDSSHLDPLAYYRRHKQCTEAAISKAVLDVNAPLLTAYHDDKVNGTPASDIKVASGR